MVTGFCLLWKNKCKELGVNMRKIPSASPWHQVYLRCLKQLKSFKCEDTYRACDINLQNSKKNVKAVDYLDGYLCTGKI